VFVVPETDASETFEFQWKGDVYTFPKMANVTFDQISLLSGLGDLPGLRTLFEAISPEFAERALGRMSTNEIGAVVTAWQEDSGITLGESTASSTSS
jgi:hypothetical protein